MPWAGGPPSLLFSDLLSGVLFRLDGDKTTPVRSFDGETVSAVIPLADGGSVVALHRSLAVFDEAGNEAHRIPLDLAPGLRLSDATAGPSGHLWIGVVPAGDEPLPGALLRYGADGVRVIQDGVGFSNGLGFSSDGTTMVHIDSDAGTIFRRSHDPHTGDVGDPEEFYRVPENSGALDGLCLDDGDRVWVALFGGGEVVCIDTDGAVVDNVLVPALRTSSCTFVGSTLYITTARVGASDLELAEFTLSGSLFRYETSVSGGPVWEGRIA